MSHIEDLDGPRHVVDPVVNPVFAASAAPQALERRAARGPHPPLQPPATQNRPAHKPQPPPPAARRGAPGRAPRRTRPPTSPGRNAQLAGGRRSSRAVAAGLGVVFAAIAIAGFRAVRRRGMRAAAVYFLIQLPLGYLVFGTSGADTGAGVGTAAGVRRSAVRRVGRARCQNDEKYRRRLRSLSQLRS